MAKLRFSWAAIAVGLVGGLLISGPSAVKAAELAEPRVGGPGPAGDYLRLIHDRVHPVWVDGFIRISPYKQLGSVTSERGTEVSINIRWDGTVESIDVTRSSGWAEFDAAALGAISLAAPFPPPVDVMADDGLAHLKWRFARNFRLCSGAEIVRVEFPLQIALPNLASRGQLGEALRRMNEELARSGWSGGDFVTPFVRQWLGRPNLSSQLDARAGAALAIGGDRQQIPALETELLLPQTSAIAAVALERLGVDVGGKLARALADTAESNRQSVVAAVVAAIVATPTATAGCPACVAALAATALAPRQPDAARVEMLQILGHLDRTSVVSQALDHAVKDPNAAVRGAALLAQIQRGQGRVGVIRMSALLRDRAPEIRAAAVAGVLRAGGDSGIEQLYLLGREQDSRPLIAAATELGRMSSEPSAQLLGKLLKRSDKTVRLAVIRALAGRSDATARALVDPILAAARRDSSEDSQVRALAVQGADPGDLVGIAADPRLGPIAYRALLRANLRQDAARWLFANLEALLPEDRITALGDWIAEAPQYAARK